jgi:hypothetical protein
MLETETARRVARGAFATFRRECVENPRYLITLFTTHFRWNARRDREL